MSVAVKLPALGESVVEGTVSRWLVREGDPVEVDQPICEVTTDKVDAEIPAPADGAITRILVAEGATVEVGAELAILDDEAHGAVAARAASGAAAVHAATDDVTDLRAAPAATPVARRLADEAALPLDAIRGTGSAGRITKADVVGHPRAADADSRPARRSARSAPPKTGVVASPTAPLAPLQLELEEGDRVVPMSPQRQLIAAHMVYSKQTSPHVGTVAEVDLGHVAALRNERRRDFERSHGVPLTFLPFVAYAVGRALREYPSLNASVAADAIVLRHGIHLSFAVETDKGLMAPVVRDAGHLSITGLALAIEDLSSRARSRKISPDELRGGTFTVSNPGRKGNLYGFAIINQPQVAILRMGEIVKRPVVVSAGGDDAIAIRPTMHIALSYDHRAVDGVGANAFLFRIRELLEGADFDL